MGELQLQNGRLRAECARLMEANCALREGTSAGSACPASETHSDASRSLPVPGPEPLPGPGPEPLPEPELEVEPPALLVPVTERLQGLLDPTAFLEEEQAPTSKLPEPEPLLEPGLEPEPEIAPPALLVPVIARLQGLFDPAAFLEEEQTLALPPSVATLTTALADASALGPEPEPEPELPSLSRARPAAVGSGRESQSMCITEPSTEPFADELRQLEAIAAAVPSLSVAMHEEAAQMKRWPQRAWSAPSPSPEEYLMELHSALSDLQRTTSTLGEHLQSMNSAEDSLLSQGECSFDTRKAPQFQTSPRVMFEC
jgi:hypothetical protein